MSFTVFKPAAVVLLIINSFDKSGVSAVANIHLALLQYIHNEKQTPMSYAKSP